MVRLGSVLQSAVSKLARSGLTRGKVLHGDVDDLVLSLRIRAQACIARNDAAGAREHSRQILQLITRHYGESDMRTASARIDLANHLAASGCADEAQLNYNQALLVFRHVVGEDHPHTLVLKFTQAQSLVRNNDLPSARALLDSICEASARVLGPDNEATLTYMDSLAATLVRMGEARSAKALLLDLLARRGARLSGQDCSTTLANASVLVTTLLNNGEWQEAEPLQRTLVETLRNQRGASDPETLLASSLLATILVASGELTRARILLQSICGCFAATLGRAHNETLRVFFLLGTVLMREGDDLAARAVLERSYNIAKHCATLDQMVSLRLGSELVTVLVKLRDYAAARAVLNEILPACERIGPSKVNLPPNMILSAQTQNNQPVRPEAGTRRYYASQECPPLADFEMFLKLRGFEMPRWKQ